MMLARHFLVCLLTVALGATAHAAGQPLVIDLVQSRVEVAVKATVDSFVARLTQYEPAVMLSDDGRVSSARLGFRFRDLETGKDARNQAMHKWQQTDTFPDGSFILTSLVPANGSALNAFGRLTFHGVTQDIQFPVSVAREGNRYAIDGEAAIDTRKHGLPIIRMLGLLKVNPVVHVRFHLQGVADLAGGVSP